LLFENPTRIHHWAAWALLGLFIVFLNRYTGWDQAISNVFFDPQAANFPLKQNQWLGLLLHDGLRWLAAGIWLGFGFLLCLKPFRLKYGGAIVFILLVSLLTALVVSILKAQSVHSCPWDLKLYGGTADYFRLFQNTRVVANRDPEMLSQRARIHRIHVDCVVVQPNAVVEATPQHNDHRGAVDGWAGWRRANCQGCPFCKPCTGHNMALLGCYLVCPCCSK